MQEVNERFKRLGVYFYQRVAVTIAFSLVREHRAFGILEFVKVNVVSLLLGHTEIRVGT